MLMRRHTISGSSTTSSMLSRRSSLPAENTRILPPRGSVLRRIQQMRETMEPLRESQIANNQNAQQVYEDMKRRDPEFWKAFGFASERD